jgi:lipoate-protein ligase A
MNSSIYISNSLDVYKNLALETYLLEKSTLETILFLWKNSNTVVIGKNQNAYKECLLQNMEKDGVKLARRPTGGGAVYHHLGNLNFTFISPSNPFSIDNNFKTIISALNNLNIDAKLNGRNDITVNNKKFSGNAFLKTKTRDLHHGTILINEDLSILSKYLNVNPIKFKSKGVDSIKSRVINLTTINQNITAEKIVDELIKEHQKKYGLAIYKNLPKESEYLDIYSKYSSREWIFGQNPNTNISFTTFLSSGEFSINIDIKNDKITYIKVYSDTLDTILPNTIESSLKGQKFLLSDIKKILTSILGNISDANLIATELENYLKA